MLLTLLLAVQLCASLAALATSPLYLESRETGVESCSLELKTSDVPGLAAVTDVARFGVVVHLRYMSTPSTSGDANQVRIQGAIYSDVPERPLPPAAPGTAAPKLPFDPPSFNFDPGLVLRPLAASSNHSGFKLQSEVFFSLGFVISTVPSYFEASFTIPSALRHDFHLSALHGGPGLTCTVRPTLVPNRLDPRGIHIDLDSMRRSTRAMPSEATLIAKPLFNNMRADLAAALLDRHIQHYAMIGFTRYIMYLHPRDVEPLLAQPRARKWAQQGFLLLIKWDAVPPHPDKPLWGHRAVHTHAVLAHLGRPVFLLMADLDEYMVSLKPGLQNVFDMVQACTGPKEELVNLQLTRMNVLAKNWGDRTQSEQPLWTPDTRNDHPIIRAHLINMNHPPYTKSMVNPNFIRVFFVHVGSQYRKYRVTQPDRQCMVLAHAINLNSGREHMAWKLKMFEDAPVWLSALARLGAQREQWLASGSSAAAMVGPGATAVVAAALGAQSGTVAEAEPRRIITVGPDAAASISGVRTAAVVAAALPPLKPIVANEGAPRPVVSPKPPAVTVTEPTGAAMVAAAVAPPRPVDEKGGALQLGSGGDKPSLAAGGPKVAAAATFAKVPALSGIGKEGERSARRRVVRAMSQP